jgi:hypothetical protein
MGGLAEDLAGGGEDVDPPRLEITVTPPTRFDLDRAGNELINSV